MRHTEEVPLELLAELKVALQPFAQMRREGDELLVSEVACQRGTAEDMSLITSSDFHYAYKAYMRLKEIMP